MSPKYFDMLLVININSDQIFWYVVSKQVHDVDDSNKKKIDLTCNFIETSLSNLLTHFSKFDLVNWPFWFQLLDKHAKHNSSQHSLNFIIDTTL